MDNSLIKLVVMAVAYNAPLSIKIKDVLSVPKLKELQITASIADEGIYKAIMLMGFFGFYRLSTSASWTAFSASRVPTHRDIIWGSPEAYIVIFKYK